MIKAEGVLGRSPFATEDEARQYFSVSLSTVRRWRRAGTGPKYFRCGDILRYHWDDLESFAEAKSSPEAA
jgi:hypothetical protein